MDKLSLCVTFLQLWLACLSTSASVAADEVTKYVGEDWDLQVSMPEGQVIVVEWTKAGEDVFFYRSGEKDSNQDPSFRNRVQLRDSEIKSGTLAVSGRVLTVTLKNVTMEDSGTYNCEGLVQTSRGKQQTFSTTVQLNVVNLPEDVPVNSALKDGQAESHGTDTHLPLILGCSILALVICVAVVAYVLRNKICKIFKTTAAGTVGTAEAEDPVEEPTTPTSVISEAGSLTRLLRSV